MKWEYRQLEVKTGGFWDQSSRLPAHCVSELNTLGNQGWEVVQAVPMARHLGLTGYVVFILKRELQ